MDDARAGARERIDLASVELVRVRADQRPASRARISAKPRERTKPEARDRRIDLDVGLVQLRVDGRFELVGELANASERRVARVVRRPCGANALRDARVALETVVELQPFADTFVRVASRTRSVQSRTTMPSTTRMPLSIAASRDDVRDARTCPRSR